MFSVPRPGALDIKRCFVRDCSGSLGKQLLTAVGVVVGCGGNLLGLACRLF